VAETWCYITAGISAGYWVAESAETMLR